MVRIWSVLPAGRFHTRRIWDGDVRRPEKEIASITDMRNSSESASSTSLGGSDGPATRSLSSGVFASERLLLLRRDFRILPHRSVHVLADARQVLAPAVSRAPGRIELHMESVASSEHSQNTVSKGISRWGGTLQQRVRHCVSLYERLQGSPKTNLHPALSNDLSYVVKQGSTVLPRCVLPQAEGMRAFLMRRPSAVSRAGRGQAADGRVDLRLSDKLCCWTCAICRRFSSPYCSPVPTLRPSRNKPPPAG